MMVRKVVPNLVPKRKKGHQCGAKDNKHENCLNAVISRFI